MLLVSHHFPKELVCFPASATEMPVSKLGQILQYILTTNSCHFTLAYLTFGSGLLRIVQGCPAKRNLNLKFKVHYTFTASETDSRLLLIYCGQY